MDILFSDAKTARACTERRVGQRRWGQSVFNKVIKRLGELQAAESLQDMIWIRGAHLEQLAGDRSGDLSVRAGEAVRIVFRPHSTPLPTKPDGGLDLAKVDSIVVLEVIDYHD